MAVVAVGGAILALEAKEIVYGAIGLAASLLGVATLFFLLEAPYVAVFQIAVYVGAVAVLILFTVMLVRQEKWAKEVRLTSLTRIAGILTGGAVAVVIAVAAYATNLAGFTSVVNTATFLDIGQLISTGDSPVLEILALVLAASIVAALTLSRADREDNPQ
jgi:NADH:ubiquinone oxidoreductase subunit 6 (subunit J)